MIHPKRFNLRLELNIKEEKLQAAYDPDCKSSKFLEAVEKFELDK